jgi:membrane protein implicated in regulation of membrane protease activity
VIFSFGLILGFVLTMAPIMTPQTWIYWVGGRILWQLGGSLWLFLRVMWLMGFSFFNCLMGILLGILVGLVQCYNPVLDVICGPQLFEGRVINIEKQIQKIYRRTGFSQTTHSIIKIETHDGERAITLTGPQTFWEEVFEQVQRSHAKIRVVILRHLHLVLEVQESPTGQERR